MSRKSRFLLTVVVIVMGLATIASTCPPPPPDPCYCSPGYWKNHEEVWVGFVPAGDVGWLRAGLNAKGMAGAGRPLREAAAAYLNSFPGLDPDC